MKDHLIQATAAGIRAFAVVTTALTEEARRRHDCYPVAAAALGRTLTGALLLAANLKNREALTVKINGDGPLGAIVVDASYHGAVRGYVHNPHIDLPLREGKLDVGKAVGRGMMHVTRHTGLKQPFTGSAPLVSGEIGEDFTHYLFTSEQTPSSVAVGVLINPDSTVAASGGFFVQALPDAPESALAKLEDNVALLPPVSQLIHEGMDAAGILDKVFAGLPVMMYDPEPVFFACQCSRDKVANMIKNLGAAEIEGMLADGHHEVVCHFCGEKYVFTPDELKDMLRR